MCDLSGTVKDDFSLKFNILHLRGLSFQVQSKLLVDMYCPARRHFYMIQKLHRLCCDVLG